MFAFTHWPEKNVRTSTVFVVNKTKERRNYGPKASFTIKYVFISPCLRREFSPVTISTAEIPFASECP